jgi:anti-sigma factor (TIGR02949 family)
VECRKYQEHITAAVDNALERNERELLEAHLVQCPACRSEFEYEKLTRSLVKSRCKREQTPRNVLAHLEEQIDRAAQQPVERRPWWNTLFVSPYLRPAIGFALAAILVVLLLDKDIDINAPRVIQASLLPDNDIIRQSLDNYRAVVSGQIKPTLASNRAEEMKEYFSGKTEFPVLVPTMNDCELLGGVLNEFGGKALAHVVYNHRTKELIYVYEACWQTVQGGTPLHLAKDVQNELNKSGWYSTTAPDGRSLVMWTNGTTLCSAVSMLDAKTLKECLIASW